MRCPLRRANFVGRVIQQITTPDKFRPAAVIFPEARYIIHYIHTSIYERKTVLSFLISGAYASAIDGRRICAKCRQRDGRLLLASRLWKFRIRERRRLFCGSRTQTGGLCGRSFERGSLRFLNIMKRNVEIFRFLSVFARVWFSVLLAFY